MSGLTYDTGALLAAERNDRRMWALHRRVLERGQLATVPATVIAEGWRDQPELVRLLDGCVIESLDDARARAAGVLLALSRTRVGAVDATVVEGALRRGDQVVTSDRQDLEALATTTGRRLGLIDI